MKNPEDAQQKMRERNARKNQGEHLVQPKIATSDDRSEVLWLKDQISALITENNHCDSRRQSSPSDLVGKTNPARILFRSNSTTSLSTATREDARFNVSADLRNFLPSADWFNASTSIANPATAIAGLLPDTHAGIRPSDAALFNRVTVRSCEDLECK